MIVTVVGNLCADPELRRTAAGVAVTELRVAENRPTRDEAGERRQTTFYSVVAWRLLAEHAAASLRKGDRVVAVGRMRQDEWTTETGAVRRRYVIHADDVGASVSFADVTVGGRRNREPVVYAPDDPERPFET